MCLCDLKEVSTMLWAAPVHLTIVSGRDLIMLPLLDKELKTKVVTATRRRDTVVERAGVSTRSRVSSFLCERLCFGLRSPQRQQSCCSPAGSGQPPLLHSPWFPVADKPVESLPLQVSFHWQQKSGRREERRQWPTATASQYSTC